MITAYYVRTWLHWLTGTMLTLVVERVLLGPTWLTAAAAALTLALFVTVTYLMYGDWRSARRAGVTCIFRDIDRG